ncbi:ATP-binding protein [Streptomyces coffeae]|uniref:ATP-binding protein n=1 Tax=Streptomyces coffeae TaxID=621382 RepID=A0ABS1NR66_9ACTN|nr:ATP-binding protein [Streptomyces coffeae]MBL1102590.1 ATP-binding protein [Streptomyces coffeae]
MTMTMVHQVLAPSSVDVPVDDPAIGRTRHHVRELLCGWGVAESAIDDAVLVLSELLTNACHYGRPLVGTSQGPDHVRVSWRIDRYGRLTIAVTDGGGDGRPRAAEPSSTAHSGRGLHIVDALSESWGVDDAPDGQVTVWASMDLGVHGAGFAANT